MNNIVLCGFMGSGKTVVGKELAKIMGVKFVDTDEMIEKEQGVAIKAILPLTVKIISENLSTKCARRRQK